MENLKLNEEYELIKFGNGPVMAIRNDEELLGKANKVVCDHPDLDWLTGTAANEVMAAAVKAGLREHPLVQEFCKQ